LHAAVLGIAPQGRDPTATRRGPLLLIRRQPIVRKFSQETLGEMLGTTRSCVSFFMNRFCKLSYIEYNGKLEIHNSLLNVALYDKPEIKTRDASEEPK
jgi:hypothetical protein